MAKEKERIQLLKLQLAKRNRGILAIQRQLDNTPDRTELAQYQRRFLELYNESMYGLWKQSTRVFDFLYLISLHFFFSECQAFRN